MKNQTLTRKELYDLVWSCPIATLAIKYFISAEGLRKICIKMNIPIPMQGHWNKLLFNKPVEVKKLPKAYTGENKISLPLREVGDPAFGTYSPIAIREMEIKEREKGKLKVSGKLKDPHRLIIEAQESLTEKDRHRYDGGIIQTKSYQLDIRVTPEKVNRALRFMDTFIKLIESRGYRIKNERKYSYLMIDQDDFRFKFRELLEKVPDTSLNRWSDYDYVATGILTFNLVFINREYEWKDGKVPLEKQLAKIIALLELKYEEIEKDRERHRKSMEAMDKKERLEMEKIQRKEKELDDFISLLNISKRWQETEVLRKYINAVQTNTKKNHKNSDEMKNWFIWARKKADWYDPLLESSDEFLNEYDRNSLTYE
jgi:hypothetical protein